MFSSPLISSGTGGDFTTISTKTANYTAASGERIPVNTSAGAVTITLPLSPADGDKIAIVDLGYAATNAITMARNGETIMGVAEDMEITTDNISFELHYIIDDWRLV